MRIEIPFVGGPLNRSVLSFEVTETVVKCIEFTVNADNKKHIYNLSKNETTFEYKEILWRNGE